MNPHDNEKNKTQVAASINKYFPVTKEELRVQRKLQLQVYCVRLGLTMSGRTQIARQGSVAFNNRLVGMTVTLTPTPLLLPPVGRVPRPQVELRAHDEDLW